MSETVPAQGAAQGAERGAQRKTEMPQKWLQCNGQQLRKLFYASLVWLDQHHQQVNALNVFPVPDGDTGTNMLLTMRAAYNRVQDSQEMHAGRMAQELAQGALMGARGNSGVILSQIWRGMARSLDGKEVVTARDVADAFEEAAETAYKGVMRPVEGTILTVVREGSEEAQEAVQKSSDLRFLLERVLERCQQTLERTPDMLDELKQAGVVDSGGQGLVYILEGMLLYVNGQMREMESAVTPRDRGMESAGTARDAQARGVSAQALAAPEEGELEFPYDVQFILMGEGLDVGAVRQAIDAMGDSTLVVGDERAIKVHVHVRDPGRPLSYANSVGRITDVVVENMQMQMEALIAPATPAAGPMPAGTPAVDPDLVGVVAVAAGPGLAELFRSLGAAVVAGGQGHNPSTEEIFRAIEEAPMRRLIVLPNNKNVILAAEAAAEAARELTQKEVLVAPTRTAPEGISAMLALNPRGDLHETCLAMHEAGKQVASGEITVASRSVNVDGVTVTSGELIGLVDGRVCTSCETMDEALARTLADMAVEERELVSVYYGQDVSEEEAAEIVQRIKALYPHVDVELLPGGQPHYMYILGAE